MNNKKIIIFKTIDDMADFVIAQWKTISEKAIKEKGYFSVALSGGKTPVFLYKKLSHQKTFRWDKTHIFMVDERFVPYENEENNFHMINNALLTHVSIPKKTYMLLQRMRIHHRQQQKNMRWTCYLSSKIIQNRLNLI